MVRKKENIQGISKRNDKEGRKKDHRCMERGRIEGREHREIEIRRISVHLSFLVNQSIVTVNCHEIWVTLRSAVLP